MEQRVLEAIERLKALRESDYHGSPLLTVADWQEVAEYAIANLPLIVHEGANQRRTMDAR